MEDNKQDHCIIHSSSCDDSEKLVFLKDASSWQSLLGAARIRNHRPLLEIEETLQENEIPNISYHRKCRMLFTMKRDLEKIKEVPQDEANKNERGEPPEKRPCTRASSSNTSIRDPECIFCGKDKFQKITKTREKLIQAVQLRADNTLRQCAKSKQDTKILAITSQDIVAAKANYHASCYKNYTRSKREASIDYKTGGCDEKDLLYEEAEEQAYAELFDCIRNEIIPNKNIVSVTSLTESLETFMSEQGQALKGSAKKNTRRKLESHFKEAIQIFPNCSGKLLLVPHNVSVQDVVLENQSLSRELDVWKARITDVNKIIDQASSQIREAIRSEMKATTWPCHPDDISSKVQIPTKLHRFLVGVMTGNSDVKNPSKRVISLVESFGQDLIYAVTRGQCKPPKHLLLPYAVKTLTGNIEIIRTLNRFGHGISYSQMEENDTALCLQKLAQGLNERVVLPSSIKPNVFTNLAWDNIDRLEETLSGQGTSHRVNGIAVQPRVFGPDPPPVKSSVVAKSKQRTLTFDKQAELPVYVAGSRMGPHALITKEDHVSNANDAANQASNKNMLWILSRQVDTTNQRTPSWTGFNIKTRDQVHVSQDVIHYLPTINAPASNLTTVFEILNQSENIRKKLCLNAVVVVMDQALYAKACEICWKEEGFSNIILRMGTFHTICNMFSILGKRFGDAGLKDVLIESQIVAEGSINGVLEGKQYNRAVRVHKYVYEALMRLAWDEFIKWLENNDPKLLVTVNLLLEQVLAMSSDLNQEVFEKLLQSRLLTEVMSTWKEFLEKLCCQNGDLSSFWMSYVDMVEDVVLGLLRASREGNWDLHLQAIGKMIPWCFAYDKVNYARYLTPYYAQMTNIPETHPVVHEAFKHGFFSVQLSSNNPFGRIPVDQTTEVTVNKDTQTPGGTVRFSLKPATVQRYYITAEYRSAFLGQLRDMVKGEQGSRHTDLQQSRIKKDELAVTTVVDLVKSWKNPFSEDQALVSISTAKASPKEVTTDLMKAYEIGEKCYRTFKEERLEKVPHSKKFHEPLKANKLKTFSHLNQKKQITCGGRTVVLKADRSLFGRIIVMAQGRNLQMEHILSHPLGPLPWALATPDGFLRKTNKATLANLLQRNVPRAERIPSNAAAVIDGMSLVQKVNADHLSFGDVAVAVLNMALREGDKCKRIDVVFDTYQEISVKNSERSLQSQ